MPHRGSCKIPSLFLGMADHAALRKYASERNEERNMFHPRESSHSPLRCSSMLFEMILWY